MPLDDEMTPDDAKAEKKRLKDEKKKKEHLQAASKDLKGTPYEMKINQLMKK